MTDIIERLRAAVPTYEGTPIAWPCKVRSELLLEAAAEVEKRTRERDEARAEIERQAHHIEELKEKIDAEKSCACSFDAPGDVCVAHSPALMQAWEDGWFARDCWDADWHQNPYQRKKKETEP